MVSQGIHTQSKVRTGLVYGILGAAALLAWAWPTAAHAQTYGYKPLEPVAVPDKTARAMDGLLLPVLRRFVARPIRTMEDVGSRRQKRKLMPLLVCGAEQECAVKFGRLLGVDAVIAGDMAPVGRAYAVTLRILDVRTGKTTARASSVVPRTIKPDSRALEELVVRLVAPDKYTGMLQVSVDVKGAQIFVDGKLVGTSPLRPVRLACGAHALRVTHPAYHDFVRFVRVEYKKTAAVTANLKAFPVFSATLGSKKKHVTIVKGKRTKVIYRPLPWYRKWYTVTAVAVGAAVVAAVVTGLVVASTSDSGVDVDGTTHLGTPVVIETDNSGSTPRHN